MLGGLSMVEEDVIQKSDVENAGAEQRVDLPQEPATVDLSSGLDLDPISGMELTRADLTRVIVLAGPEESGKTTLLVSLYERFQEGAFAGYLFAGSRTLLGLEKRCHRARIESGASKPDTDRTTMGPGQNLLHLRVRDSSLSGSSLDLLFTDFAGEVFRLAKDDIEECRKLAVIRRCDHLALLLDGERLDRLSTRAQVLADSLGLLRSSVEAGMLGPHSHVQVLFSKWDIVQLSQNRTRTEEYVKSVEERMREGFNRSFHSFRFFRVASRPDRRSGLPFAFSLDEVLGYWVSIGQGGVMAPPHQLPTASPLREFSRYLRRQLPGRKPAEL